MGYLVILDPNSSDMSLRGEFKTVDEAVKDARSITDSFKVVKEVKWKATEVE